ncbi:MAG: VWA domain-containing protein [Planctomycetota bacterium]|nr:VWA domain-containing protein [Planctomycetota bacterium]
MFAWLTGFFANPALLAGSAAGSIPIIIHLLNKQRYKRTWWAAMHWLWASMKKSHRRLRIEQLILLLIRVLILVLLALALARPALQEGMGLLGGRASIHRVIVLDNSYSMGLQVGGQTLFEKAKKLATQLVEDLNPGDEVDLLLVNSLVEDPRTASATKHSELARDIAAARLSDGTTHLPRGIAHACKLIKDRQSKNLRKEIVLLSDQTRNGWETGTQPKKLESVEEQYLNEVLDDPKLTPKIWVVRLSPGNARENLAASALEIDEKVVTQGVETQIVARIENLGTAPANRVPLQLYVDGEQASREELALVEPHKPATVTFRHTFLQPGSHDLRVELPHDSLAADDDAFLAVDVADQVKVLCVDGEQRSEPNASELDFLRQALSPARALEINAGKMPLQPEVISDGAFPDANLDDFRLVVLGNVALIPKEKIAVLEQYVRRGGSLWFWLGYRVDPALYNQDLGALLPCRLGEAVGSGSSDDRNADKLDEKAIDHPAISKFQNIKGLPLNQLQVFRRFKLLPKEKEDEQKSVRTVLSYENGDPAAVEWKLGEGRVLLFGTTADTAWTNWPTKNHYMPLVNFVALHLIQPEHLQRNRMVGEPFLYRLKREEFGIVRREGLKLQDPDGEPVAMDIDTEAQRAFSRPTRRAGIYSAEVPGEESLRAIHFAANRVVEEESDLDTIEDAEIQAYLPSRPDEQPERGRLFDAPLLKHQIEFLGEEFADVKEALKKHKAGKEVWRWLIVSVLLLLLAESLLAMRFGNYQK